MTRPVYENDTSTKAEREIANAVLERLDLTGWRKLTIAHGLDFVFWKGRDIRFFAEVKDRNYGYGDGDGYYLSLLKIKAAYLISQTTGQKCYIIVRFIGASIKWAPINTHDDRLIIFGPNPPRDYFDLEPCVIYPWVVFQELTHL